MFTTKTHTHFEQVPLEIVNQIVDEQIKREVTKEKQRSQTEENEDGRLKGTRFGTARRASADIKEKSCKEEKSCKAKEKFVGRSCVNKPRLSRTQTNS